MKIQAESFHLSEGASPFVDLGLVHRIQIFGKPYIIGVAGAYNAGGAIAPENNGIFLLADYAPKQVVLDQHCNDLSHIYGQPPTARQAEELKRLLELSEYEFAAWAQSSPRLRYYPFMEPLPKPTKMTQALRQEWVELYKSLRLSQISQEAKMRCLLLSKLMLKELAEALGLPRSAYRLTTNPGGHGVTGDVHLQTEVFEFTEGSDTFEQAIMVQLSAELSEGRGLMRSSCGIGDCSGTNFWFHVEELLDLLLFLKKIKRMPRSSRLLEMLNNRDKAAQ